MRRKSEKGQQPLGVDLSCQCSATELPLSYSNQKTSSPHNALYLRTGGTNASVTHLAATQYVPSELR